MLLNFYQLQLKRLRRFFATRTLAKVITVTLFAIVFGGVALGIYVFFSKGFYYIAQYDDLRDAVLLYSLELFFLLVSLLIWISALISLLFSLFRNKNNLLLAVSPKFSLIPKSVLLTTALSSAWIFSFVLLPGLIAIANTFGFSWVGLMLSVIIATVFLAVIILSAFVAVMLLARVVTQVKSSGNVFAWLSVAVGVLIILSFWFVGANFSKQNTFRLLNADIPIGEALPVQPLLDAFASYPSHFLASSVFYIEQGSSSEVLGNLVVMLVSLTLLGFVSWYVIRNFLPLWQELNSSSGLRATTTAGLSKNSKLHFAKWMKNGFRAVFYKEALLLFRNSRNSLWLLFLLVIWLCYIGISLSIQDNLQTRVYSFPELPLAILAAQLLILVYFVAALVLRFAFPSFSSERNTAWIITSSPVSLGKMIWAKFSFFAAIFSAFAIVAELINIFVLQLPILSAGVFLLIGVTSAIFVSALGVFLGAMFPSFDTDDVDSLSTSAPGLAFVFGSIIYGSVAALSYYSFLKSEIGIVGLFVLVSVILTVTMMRIATRSVNRTEIVNQH